MEVFSATCFGGVRSLNPLRWVDGYLKSLKVEKWRCSFQASLRGWRASLRTLQELKDSVGY